METPPKAATIHSREAATYTAAKRPFSRFPESKKYFWRSNALLKGRREKPQRAAAGAPGPKAGAGPLRFFPPALQERIASPKIFFTFGKPGLRDFVRIFGISYRDPYVNFSKFYVAIFVSLPPPR